MSDVEIKGRVSVDTGDSVNKVEGLKDSLTSTGEALKKTSANTQESTGHFAKLKETLGSMPGPLGEVAEGAGTLKNAFTALVANPIGLVLAAIVATLALMYKAFTNTFEGAEKVEQVFAGVKAAGQALVDNLEKIGSVIKDVFTFHWGKAIDDIKEVGNAAAEAYSKMSKLKEAEQDLHKEELQNDLEQAERKKQLAILREQATDETVPIAQRKAALKDLQKASEENAKEDIELAKKVTDNKIAQLTLQKDGELKNRDEINRLKIDQINVETDNANELRRINKQISAIDKQEAHEKEQAAKEATAAHKQAVKESEERIKQHKKELEEIQKANEKDAKIKRGAKEKELKWELALGEQLKKEEAAAEANSRKIEADNRLHDVLQKRKLAELALLNDPESEKLKIAKVKADLAFELNALADGDLQKNILAKKSANEITQIEKDAAAARFAIKELEAKQTLDITAQTFGNLADIVGRESAAGKALSVAQASITGIEGAMSAYKAMAGIPVVGPALGGIAAAAAIAAATANIKKILAVKIPGATGGGGGSVPSITVPAPISPTQATTRLDQPSINAVGNAAQGGVARAFILEADITNNAERTARLNRAARLG
jgi:hypothetical protein